MRRWLRWGLYLLAFLVAWPIVMTLVYAVVPPPFSNIMLLRALGGAGIDRQWVSLENMSPNLPRAVIASEDARFCEHRWRGLAGVPGRDRGRLDKDEAPSPRRLDDSHADGQEPVPVGLAVSPSAS